MEGCVDGALFGRSPSGWTSMELFYGWLANHFTKCVTERFLFFLLIVTARTLMWRCQILQRPADKSLLHPNSYVPHHPPLDVVFFGALKTTWERYVKNTRLLTLVSLVSHSPTYTFGRVFKDAWVVM